MKNIVIFLLLLFFSFCAYAQNLTVIDGDSLEIDGRRIRLDGIDAPEFNQICENAAGKEYACGQKALDFVINFIGSAEVDCRCLSQKDRYKREICECFVNGESLNMAVVSAGWATAYRDNAYINAEKQAKEYRRGIWQGKNMRPALYRVLQKYEEKKNDKEPYTLF